MIARCLQGKLLESGKGGGGFFFTNSNYLIHMLINFWKKLLMSYR